MKSVTILGSTGSIGTSSLDVIRRGGPERYRVHALVAGGNVELLARQIVEFRPSVAVTATGEGLRSLISRLEDSGLEPRSYPELLSGPDAYVQAACAPEVDFVMSAIVGVAGLEATYQAICSRKSIGLANKETLVAAGDLVIAACREHGTELIPVDSEHNGAHQCLRAGRRNEVTHLILTASGGPFRNTPKERFHEITPEQALNHPTWKMGRRITIDSASMMNKGFEVIEACWLFDFEPDQVDVVIHPQSSIHAMVEYNDGSVIAQISTTDMRMPIQYALTWPDRDSAPVPRMDWSSARTFEFFPPDLEKFPLLRLAYQCQRTGGSATCTLNAADEIAVEAFLNGEVSFSAIAEVVEETLSRVPGRRLLNIGEVLDVDRQSRVAAGEIVSRVAGRRSRSLMQA